MTLLNEKGEPHVTLEFKTPCVGIWNPTGKHAPFICIEPWYGRCDYMHYEGDFASRAWINHLEPGKHFAAEYTITVHR